MSVYTRQDFLDLYKLIKKKQHKKLYPDLTGDLFSYNADMVLRLPTHNGSISYYRKNHVPGMFDRVVRSFYFKLSKDSRDRFIELIKTNENINFQIFIN